MLQMARARRGNDANVVSLLHFGGADASTTITDSAPSPRTWTPAGNAQIDTGQSKFGGSSLQLDGSGDYVRGDGNSAFSFGTGDLTIDFWLRVDTTVSSKYQFDFRDTALSTNGLFSLISAGSKFTVGANGSVQITGTTTVLANTWYHIAVVRASGSTKLYVNGTNEGSAYTDSNNYAAQANSPSIGIANDGGSGAFLGWIDEFRVSNVARWTTTFTPSNKPYSRGGKASAPSFAMAA